MEGGGGGMKKNKSIYGLASSLLLYIDMQVIQLPLGAGLGTL